MVFFALTRAGLHELTEQFGCLPSPLWVNDDVLSASELAELRGKGADVSRFSNHFPSNDIAAIEGALAVIARHHPGKRIWVELGDV